MWAYGVDEARASVPGTRTRYLADIAQHGRGLRTRIEEQVEAARRAFGMFEALKTLRDAQLPGELERFPAAALTDAAADGTKRELRAAYNQALDAMGTEAVGELKAWPARVRSATDETYSYKVRDRVVTGENYTESLRAPEGAEARLYRSFAIGARFFTSS